MKNKFIVFIALLSISPAFGYIYQARVLRGSMPGQHPVNVFILSDYHEDNDESDRQQEDVVAAIVALGKDVTPVCVEDSCHYTGKDKRVLKDINEQRDNDFFLSFLIERCKEVGIQATNVDDYRYFGSDEFPIRAHYRALEKAKAEIAQYGDCPRLKKLYKEHLAGDFKSPITWIARKTAQNPATASTRIDDMVHDRTRQRLKKVHLLAPEHCGVPVQDAIIAPTSTDITSLKQQMIQLPTDPQARLAATEMLLKKVEETQQKINDAVETTEKIREKAEEELDDFIARAGAHILDVKVLHEIANVSPHTTNIVICVGGAHADAVTQLLTEELDFYIAWQRGDSEATGMPLNIELFFKHYFRNQAETSQAVAIQRRPAHYQPQLPIAGKRKSLA